MWYISFVLYTDRCVHGLAVNPEEDELYMLDITAHAIVVTSLNGNGEKQLLRYSNDEDVQGLAIDLNKRYYTVSKYNISCCFNDVNALYCLTRTYHVHVAISVLS